MPVRLAAFVAGLAMLAAPISAAPPMFGRIAAPPQPPGAIPLYDGPAPGVAADAGSEVWDRMPDGLTVVRNVTRPTVTPILPPPGKATGAGILILPGGAFHLLAMESEGFALARWFAAHGIAAFVVKYRIAPTPADEARLNPFFVSFMGRLMDDPEKAIAPAEQPGLADCQRALALVRARARQWHVDPAKIGVMGLSAGAMAARDMALALAPAPRPAYIGYVYGPMREVKVSNDAAPMFATLTIDDSLFGRDGFGIVDGWRKAGRPVELHVYEKGGHGFGVGVPRTTTVTMLPQFLVWLKMHHMDRAGR